MMNEPNLKKYFYAEYHLHFQKPFSKFAHTEAVRRVISTVILRSLSTDGRRRIFVLTRKLDSSSVCRRIQSDNFLLFGHPHTDRFGVGS